MTSQINQNTIDATYPVAGQDNSSQGFRDNFAAIQTNFGYASNEISALQGNAVLRNQDNDLSGNATITSGVYRTSRESIYALGTVSGTISIVYTRSSYQTMTLAGSVVLAFSGFAVANTQQTRLRLQFTVTDTTTTVTFPASVSLNMSTVAYVSGQTVSFADAGTYIFELSTNDGGTTFSISDLTRNRNQFQGNVSFIRDIAGTAETGITMTIGNVSGAAYGTITCDELITGNLVTSTNSAVFSGNVTADWFIAQSGYIGNIRTPSQTFITDVGTLNSLSVSGNANIGNLTVTGMTDMCGAYVHGVQVVADAANASSTQIWSNIGVVLIQPNATIASYTITMPATPVQGQGIKIGFANTITTLTHTVVGGQTLLGGLATANVSAGGEWIYDTNTASWYKVG